MLFLNINFFSEPEIFYMFLLNVLLHVNMQIVKYMNKCNILHVLSYMY